MNRLLIIVAHGSSVNPTAALSVVDQSRAVARRDDIKARFDRVEARFLKQSPLLSDADPHADEVVIVPFFMASGYFVREVLPGAAPQNARMTAPLGTAVLSPIVGKVVDSYDSASHVVLVGHGTPRSSTSANTVLELADRLRADLESVTAAFVDQEPGLDSVWQRVPDDGRAVVVVPCFAFAGPHTTHDIPRALGLADAGVGPHEIGGHCVYYAAPIGEAPEVPSLLAQLALDL